MDDDLPPLEEGLPNTPYRNCAALIAAVIYQAVADKDYAWIASQYFNFYMSLLGFDPLLTLEAKRKLLNREVRVPLYFQPNFLEV